MKENFIFAPSGGTVVFLPRRRYTTKKKGGGAMILPQQVQTALTLLHRAGFAAYVVGGAVRDGLRGMRADDWDITTAALPEQVERVFSDFRRIETGIRHGTVTVLLDGLPLEITTYRRDGAYTDHRRPDSVSFSDRLEEDLARRDFTINAMAYHPDEGLIDPFGGQDDLARGVIRCVGEPEKRFSEDALRILRALRFAATLDMTLEERTRSAAFSRAPDLRQIASERVQIELTKLLCGAAAERVLQDATEIVGVVLPEILPCAGFAQHIKYHDKDVWAHCLAAMQAVPQEPVLRWAALLHDVGKPACFTMGDDGTGHFYDHAEKSAAIAEEILTRLRFDTARKEQIVTLVRNHDLPLSAQKKPLKRLLSRFGEQTLRQLLAIHRADTRAHAPCCFGRLEEYDRVEAALDALLQEQACFSLKDLAINGRDVMALGLQGKAVGAALSACLDAVIDETLPNERAALLSFLKCLPE